MIKLIINLTKIAVLLIMSLLMSSCVFKMNLPDTINGNGEVVEQLRNLNEKFDKIEVSAGIEVELIQGVNSSVVVIADENLLDEIKTEVSNGTLTIYSDKIIRKSTSKKVNVVMPNLSQVELSSGAKVLVNDLFTTSKLKIDSSSGASFKGGFQSTLIQAESSSGSSIELVGVTNELKLESSSGSAIKAEGMKAQQVKAEASSGSSIHVWPASRLDASASSGASITYFNTPESLNTSTSSGGNIKAK